MSLHNKLERETRIEGHLVLKTPLLVGSQSSETQAPDITPYTVPINGKPTPCIPGTSIKGVFRSTIEKILLEASKKNPRIRVCDILNYRDSCGGKIKNRLNKALRHDNIKVIKEIINNFCHACQIFGSPGYRGKLSIADSFPINNYGKFSLNSKKNIAINRLSGEAKRYALYSMQFVEPGSVFNLSLRAVNLSTEQLSLLFHVFKELDGGRARLGGFSTKGFGHVKIYLTECKLGSSNIATDYKELPLVPEELSENQSSRSYTKHVVRKIAPLWNDYVSGGI